MSRPTLLFCAIALLSAAGFVRLGLWQVDRLRARQATNALIAQQRLSASVPFGALPRDTAQAHYRTASVEGRPDYEHELVLAIRTRRGSPGVELVTPVRVEGSDTAVLVNRGWVYSPDGGSVDRAKWREGDRVKLAGYVELFASDSGARSSADPRIIWRMSRSAVTSRIPYPVAPFYLVAVGDTADLSHPARRDLPALSEGSHRGYAFQWFSFAVIAIVGAGIKVAREHLASSRS